MTDEITEKTNGVPNLADTLASGLGDDLKGQLSHTHMVTLGSSFLEWALDPDLSPEQAQTLITSARKMCDMALDVGPDWNPPEPEQLSIVGFIARQFAPQTA